MDIFVPGRICLFGEHTDWAGGYRRINAELNKGLAIICGTNQGIYAKVSHHPDKLMISSTINNDKSCPVEFPMNQMFLAKLALSDSPYSYIAGVAYQFLVHYQVGGLIIDNYQMDLPLKKGLSSSAAICVLIARAFNQLYGLKLTVRGEMDLAYRGEISTHSRCGRMDQGCAYGNTPVIMTFDGDSLDVQKINLFRNFYFVIVDLKGKKDTIKILTKLNQCFPFQENTIQKGVKQYLGEISETITKQASEALESGDPESLGKLMSHAQEEFDRYCVPVCPEELQAPLLHKLLKHKNLAPYILGGKGVGSQGDGSAQLLVKNEMDQEKVISIIKKELGMTGLKLTIKRNMKVRKAVIPAAGYGTRLFPATKVIKKEFFPVIDHSGRVKPAILIIIEELLSAGIEEIGIIVKPSDKQIFDEFFKNSMGSAHFNQLSQTDKKYWESLHDIGKKITFITQEEQKGFGHAIYCAKEWVGREPFLINLGDHIFFSHEKRSCSKQLIDLYEETGVNVVGVKPEHGDSISNFGCVQGDRNNEQEPSVVKIAKLVEKPSITYARDNLVTPGLEKNHFLTFSGQYVLTPRIFSFLEEQIERDISSSQEIQLTPCLDQLRESDGILGLQINGERFDIGLPELYRKTLTTFPREEQLALAVNS